MEIEQVARICHETVRACDAAFSQPGFPPWDEAPAWMRTSTIASVEANLLSIQNTGAPLSPIKEHERWMQEKLAAGYSYGPVKDLKAKVHPLLVPYDKLPNEQRLKDYLMICVIEGCYDWQHAGEPRGGLDSVELSE